MRLDLEPNVSNAPFADLSTPRSANAEQAEAIIAEGIMAAKHGDLVNARQLLDRAVGLDPRSESAWLWLASISEYPEELLGFLRNVLEINPQNQRAIEWSSSTRALLAKTLVQRGIEAAKENNNEQALDLFEQALTYDEQDQMAWLWIASLSGSEDRKMEYLERVLTINPDNEEARSALESSRRNVAEGLLKEARTAAVAGERLRALELLEAVDQQCPELKEVWMLRAHLEERFEEKARAYERLLDIDPENTAARAGLDTLNAILASAEPSAEPQSVDELPNDGQVQAETSETSAAEEWDSGREEPVHPLEPDVVEPSEDIHATFPAHSELAVTDELENIDSYEFSDDGSPSDESFSIGAHPVELIEESDVDIQSIFETGIPRPSDEELPIPNPSHEKLFVIGPDDEPFADRSDLPSSTCPFCASEIGTYDSICLTCGAGLAIDDIDALMQIEPFDVDAIKRSVDELASERRSRVLDENELLVLAIGQLNLKNYREAYVLLEEAAAMDPVDPALSNALRFVADRIPAVAAVPSGSDKNNGAGLILVVDDSATVRKLITAKLEKAGLRVYAAEDGIEAIAMLNDFVPDLVLLDITMPRMDGYQVCRAIRNRPETRNVPVVMISGNDGFFDKVRGRMAGSSGYITKPFGPDTLMKTLETYLASKNDLVAH